ncbi:hypothetical protein L1987_54812 [Smallanthus sonchifolius]|uniref:Uncharacterized protein n=1 Tax=Smallanthus sonchifolius TaxID=185202 RepID=A0ACB9E7S7_9ASTR|nr:hypothetical protein L1987_54812 [Smallanthus sonchifolius]
MTNSVGTIHEARENPSLYDPCIMDTSHPSHRQNMVDENIQIEMQDEGADASISCYYLLLVSEAVQELVEKTESLSVSECLEPDFTCFNGMMDSTSLLLNYMLELDRLCCPVSLGCYRRKKTSSLEITVFPIQCLTTVIIGYYLQI